MSEVTDPDLQPMRAWSTGDTVGRYLLVAALARGGMAELWLARQSGPQNFEKVVVVKRILPSIAPSESFITMFLDEARIVSQLNHPNIVQVIELGELDGSYFIAMEYLHGDTLAHLARAATQNGSLLPAPIAVRLVAEAAEGLGHAHTRRDVTGKPLGIVHRDVSPQNIMVTYDGIVKVLDFGIAKATSRSTQTEAGTLKGKLQYMAPEQARAHSNVGPPADVFSLGVILFELITGTRLHGDATDLELMARLQFSDPFPRARDRLETVSSQLDRIIAKAMSEAPADRYQDGRELAAALTDWLHTQRATPSALDVEALAKSLLAERMQKRQNLLQVAMTEAPSGPIELTPGFRSSMPGRTVYDGPPVQPPQRRRLAVWAVFLASLGFVGAVAVWNAFFSFSMTPVARPTRVAKPAAAPPTPAAVMPPAPVPVVDSEGPAPAEATDADAGALVVARVTGGAETASPQSERPPQVRREPAPVPRLKKGLLRLETQPWTEVLLGTRALGATPLVDVPLPPGTHTLRLVNEEQKIDRRIEVEIRGDETTALRLNL